MRSCSHSDGRSEKAELESRLPVTNGSHPLFRHRGLGEKSGLTLLQLHQDFPCPLDDLLGQSRQLRHLDAIAPVGSSRDQLMEEEDLILPFLDGDVEILHAGPGAGQVRQFVIVGGEERLHADALRSCRYSATAQAMLSPSKVLVPRPISSRMIRLRGVA